MEKRKLGRILTAVLWTVVIILAVVAVDSLRRSRKGQTRIPNSDWAKLMLVLGSVERDYVDAIDKKEVTEKLLPLVMSELDPHSVYLPPQDLKDAEEDLQGGFDGIGIQFNVPNDTAVISNVISGGPSEKAGLLSGDRLLAVDGKNIAGVKFPQDSMVRLMKGQRGTKVKILIGREGESKPLEFTIVRDKIPVNSIDVAFMLNDTTGYVKLSKFARTSYFEFLAAAVKLREQGMKRLVFDLRENTGGYLDQALLLSNEFLDKGDLVVYMEGRNRARQDMFADGRGSCRDIALDVLIDENTASSSEIFAGAMQDNDRAVIYGRRSYGKGLVQEPVYFSDGSGIRLTVARYYTPSGRCIQKPYSDYKYDLFERYQHGEMMSADSIRVNDSLKFTTKSGRAVYGGGGIIPDVFVPLDTVGVTDYLVRCNRQSLQVKFAGEIADKYRSRMRDIKDMAALTSFLDGLGLKERFIQYTSSFGVTPSGKEWEISGEIILTQVKALIGRYTAMNDDAFYPIFLTIDNVVQKVMEPSEK